MKASRLVPFFVCVVSIASTNNRSSYGAPAERQMLRSNQGQNSTAEK
jgi:hypothetical protein